MPTVLSILMVAGFHKGESRYNKSQTYRGEDRGKGGKAFKWRKVRYDIN